MIDVAANFSQRSEIQYFGIDPFEDRTQNQGLGLTFIDAHRLFKRSGAKVKLIPGDPLSGVERTANTLGQVDLLLISSQFESSQLDPLWIYIPRLLHEHTLVFLEQDRANGRKAMLTISHHEINHWASQAIRRKAA
jgi:hypothetical protein